MTGKVLNMTGKVLNITGKVLNMTDKVLNMTGKVLNSFSSLGGFLRGKYQNQTQSCILLRFTSKIMRTRVGIVNRLLAG
jgi:hypothetical protein